MTTKNNTIIKYIAFVLIMTCAITAGLMFREHRNYDEAVVPSASLTEVKKLSDYCDIVKGTANDCNVYIYDSGVPGGSILMFGGTHPEEPAANMTSLLLAENLNVTQGRVFIINRANRSASLTTRNGEAYPRFYSVDTPWGEKTWRMGDRHGSALDSWPDPEVYMHYPTHQNLAYIDIRNLNRAFPGKKDGLLMEKTGYAIMELVRKEGINLTIDFHEAELEYPVENVIVAHEKGQGVAAMAAMMLTAQTFDVPIGMEFSPTALRGLSHREIGDNSDAASYLFEVAEPMLDRIRGITDEELLLSGKDVFVIRAGEEGLLYAPIDENGWPITKRVARHVETALTIIENHNMMNPTQVISVSGVPRYSEIMEKGVGTFYHNPAEADQVYYD